ncbi:MAG: hypothetical protein ACE5OZ_02630 [Candidatus Heimdallarchaeota archaeon]
MKDMQEAFDAYLGEGQPAIATMFLPDGKETIATIKTAGGIAVVLHPIGFWNNDLETLDGPLNV